jgi:hypothetical protein
VMHDQAPELRRIVKDLGLQPQFDLS